MSLYLRPPRAGKTPNFEIRGTYLGVTVERSSGTPKRSVAVAELRRLEHAIESGEYPPKSQSREGQPTFLSAAIAYMQQGGKGRYVSALIKRFGETPLPLAQEAIDDAALEMYPNVSPASRNSYVYTPVSAIMHHALGKQCPPIRRPKGFQGKVRTDFLSPEDATAIVKACAPDMGVLLTFLLYTGCRLGEALSMTWEELDLEKRLAWVRTSKNGDPRTVLLREDLCQILAPRRAVGRVFPWGQGGNLAWKLRRATLAVCGISAPKRRPNRYPVPAHRLSWVNFHTYCHTWASWMRRYGGADIQGLVATGRWRSTRAAARYSHVVARDDWDRVEKLPKIG